MAEYTDGKWTVHTGMKITGQAGLTYVADCYPFNERMNRPRLFEAKANAKLICALHNAAVEINPENPLAVAEGMKGLYRACKQALRTFEARGIPPTDGRYTIINQAIAKAEGK